MVFNGAEAFKGEGPALERELSVCNMIRDI
jgi:hypothetical protein